MSKLTVPLKVTQCQSRVQCFRDAKWGLYGWSFGETDVNLNKPIKVFCGQHKPRLNRNQLLRNVRVG